MNEKKLTEKQLGRLRLAYEVQQIANPYLKQGIYSKTAIYLNFVVKEIPICINTFKKNVERRCFEFPTTCRRIPTSGNLTVFKLSG